MKLFDHSFTFLMHWIYAPESTLLGEDLHGSLFCIVKNEFPNSSYPTFNSSLSKRGEKLKALFC